MIVPAVDPDENGPLPLSQLESSKPTANQFAGVGRGVPVAFMYLYVAVWSTTIMRAETGVATPTTNAPTTVAMVLAIVRSMFSLLATDACLSATYNLTIDVGISVGQ
jgi:hypothetical protein